MLPKANRITKKKEIDNVFQKGKSSFDAVLGVKVSQNKENKNRFVTTVSTKVSKKAVVRNKIKRQLQEIIRLNNVNFETGFDFFVLALPLIKDKKYNEIERSLLQHLKKLNIIKTRKHVQI